MGAARRQKIAIVALDAFEITLTAEGIRDGWLPNLAAFAERALSVPLENPVPELPGSSWVSTISATDAVHHRVIFDRQLRPGSYEIVDVANEGTGYPPFWRYLSDAGLRSTLCSVYGNVLLDDFNGAQVVGWGSYDPFSAKLPGPRVDPPELVDRLEAVAPRRRSGFLPVLPYRGREYRIFRDESIAQVSMQTAGLEMLMRETDWDLFVGAYQHGHEAGHLLWDRQEDLRLVYQAIDRDLSRIVAACPDDAIVSFLTPYGMGPTNHAKDALGVFLEQGGWTVREESPGARKVAVMRSARRVYRTLPYELRRAIGKRRPHDFAVDDPYAGIRWDRTKAFLLPHDEVSLIRINLKGREPSGIVSPGSEYDELIAELSTEIARIVDPTTGEALAAGVVRFDEVLGAPVTHAFPDVVVHWNKSEASALDSPRWGTASPKVLDPRSGSHPPTGFWIVAGPGVTPSETLFGSEPALLPDVGATVLARLGLDLPAGLSGAPIKALA